MMDFDNRTGNKLYTTNATHDAEYQQKLAANTQSDLDKKAALGIAEMTRINKEIENKYKPK